MITIAEMSDREILNGVIPIMDNLMQGSAEIDYAKHTRDFTERMKAQLSPERLESICRDYQAKIGRFGPREIVRLFRREHSVAVVWRQLATGSQDEFVAEAVFVPAGDSWRIDHAMVF
ncbi:MAG: hypothetical protein R3C60_15345 [Parvularculaceae bacterium]